MHHHDIMRWLLSQGESLPLLELSLFDFAECCVSYTKSSNLSCWKIRHVAEIKGRVTSGFNMITVCFVFNGIFWLAGMQFFGMRGRPFV